MERPRRGRVEGEGGEARSGRVRERLEGGREVDWSGRNAMWRLEYVYGGGARKGGWGRSVRRWGRRSRKDGEEARGRMGDVNRMRKKEIHMGECRGKRKLWKVG